MGQILSDGSPMKFVQQDIGPAIVLYLGGNLREGSAAGHYVGQQLPPLVASAISKGQSLVIDFTEVDSLYGASGAVPQLFRAVKQYRLQNNATIAFSVSRSSAAAERVEFLFGRLARVFASVPEALDHLGRSRNGATQFGTGAGPETK
jgi:hypothetical protein